MNDASTVFGRVRSETAEMLGYDLDHLGLAQSVRLDRATVLRIEIDRIQAEQLEGRSVDISRLIAATDQLEKLLPADEMAAAQDLSRLTNAELAELGRLLRKITPGESADETNVEAQPDPVPVEFVRLNDELAELRSINTQQSIQLETHRNIIARLEAAAPKPMANEAAAEVEEDQPAEPASITLPPSQSAPPRLTQPPAHYLKSEDEPWRPYVVAGTTLPHPP